MAYNLLKGKKGIIFGALDDTSIAWKVAERAYEEGAEILLTNAPASIRIGNISKLAKKIDTEVIPADATNLDDLENLFRAAMDKFNGGFDFILHSIGMSPNIRKKKPYDDIDYANFQKTLDISALSLHKMLQLAKKMEAINEWGSVVALSYIASTRSIHNYRDMAEAKALLESIVRSFGYIYGKEKHVRINAVSQSPTETPAGSKIEGFGSLSDFAERMSPLGNATAEDCADFCVSLFSDLTRKITMQTLFNDGGFSSMGMSKDAMMVYDKSLKAL
jgi:enoyl-[acyl-carrier protein] reductase I